MKVTSKFTISQKLRDEAKRLKLPDPIVIQDEDLLLRSFIDPNWRVFPQIVDVPANSQLFGQLVHSAQLCGILYTSKLNGAKCLAIFLRNFNNTTSFIQLDDALPDKGVVSRLDSSNWNEFDN